MHVGWKASRAPLRVQIAVNEVRDYTVFEEVIGLCDTRRTQQAHAVTYLMYNVVILSETDMVINWAHTYFITRPITNHYQGGGRALTSQILSTRHRCTNVF